MGRRGVLTWSQFADKRVGGERFTADVTDVKIKTWEGKGREGGCNESSFSVPLTAGARYQDLGRILFSKY